MGIVAWVVAFNAVVGGGLLLSRWWHHRDHAQRDLVITALRKNGEMTTLELRSVGAGVGVYQLLCELEEGGIVERISDGIEHPERGGIPRHYFRLKETKT